jgi:uncharacterized RDD family membrane protein YckC
MSKTETQLSTGDSHSISKQENTLDDKSFLTEEETKKILTPFAFKIDESLLGIPLAVPWRRGLALLIDFILIAILSGAPGELLAIVIAITFYRIGSAKKRKRVGRLNRVKQVSFQLLGAFIIFVVLVDTLPNFFEESVPSSFVANNDNDLSWTDGLALGALSTAAYQKTYASSCQDTSCWQVELLPFIEQLAEHSQNDKTVKTLIDTLVATIDEKNKLNRETRKELEQYFFNDYLGFKTQIIAENLQGKPEATENIELLVKAESVKLQSDENVTGYKGVEWLKGIIEDLGLGFGWAAFYFTVLTSIWHGQTPGKKLFKVRVIQLDGTKLSMWDSFGRYGGYGAGLATGLLGFLQIYWDPNRQAIHDKISATIVIDVTNFERMKRRDIEKAKFDNQKPT